MKNLTHNENNFSNFIVSNNQVNNNNILLPVILYKKMEALALYAANPFKEYISSKPSIKKLDLLKSSSLNDKLSLKSHLKKFGEGELQFAIEVFKVNNNSKNLICKTTFSFKLNQNAIKRVS